MASKSKIPSKSNDLNSQNTRKKKPFSHKKSSKSNNVLAIEKIDSLKTFFFMGGITPHQAAIQTGCDPKTVKTYFTEWAEELVEDDEHITWVQREQHARARYQEGKTKEIFRVKKHLNYFEKRMSTITYDKNKKIIDKPDEDLIEKYQRYITSYGIQLNELQQDYATIEMMPPTEVIMQKEIERIMNEKLTS